MKATPLLLFLLVLMTASSPLQRLVHAKAPCGSTKFKGYLHAESGLKAAEQIPSRIKRGLGSIPLRQVNMQYHIFSDIVLCATSKLKCSAPCEAKKLSESVAYDNYVLCLGRLLAYLTMKKNVIIQRMHGELDEQWAENTISL
ncbi:hypothetical protein BaRGS_00019281 [Batillaria attramentaria]|uniref:Uncharacterized protein n=1 Tax=Batillaria attramentaria TaxID=370345 RepID=A0ABD0KQG7_9CAEN